MNHAAFGAFVLGVLAQTAPTSSTELPLPPVSTRPTDAVKPPETAFPLLLRCSGTAIVNHGGSATVQTFNGQNWSNSTVDTSERSSVPWSARVEVAETTVRIRPEAFPIPPMHKALVNGWWSLADVAISDNEITGTLDLNWLNRPQVIIDRVSGTITIHSHLTRAVGTCLKLDPGKRAF